MATLADSLVSSSARALPLRMRPDLKAEKHRYQGRVYWIVKDPVGLHYFRFQEEEFAILKMLDCMSSLDQLKHRFERQFPPQKITVEELGQFIGMLHKSALVITDVPGQGYQLKKRRDERKRKELLGALSNILAIRFKGIDPDRLLNWLHPKMRWMYSPVAVFCCMTLAIAALTLVLVQFNVFRSKLPSFHQFFTAQNWIYLGATLAVTKVIHEFGHGLTCKHFGGECHEMGVMVLVLTPCLYCNVSDSWMLPNKWHRAYIGAAGMYIELVMASICTFLWWYSEPGLLNQICLSVMFVCSVSTVMFNGNPLLRYDGYYILADLVEIPNLRQKATTILSRKLGHWCLGLEEPEDPFLPQRNQGFFALYSVAAAIYRWIVMFSILWFLYKVLEPYKLKALSQMIASISVISLVAVPLYKVGKFFYIPGRLQQVKRKNLQVTLLVMAAVTLAIFAVPLPYRVICTLEVRARDAQPVYVTVGGTLLSAPEMGTHVNEGDLLAEIDNPDLEMEVADLQGQVAAASVKLRSAARVGAIDPSGQGVGAIKKLLDSHVNELAEKEIKLKQLDVVAPVGGVVLPAISMPKRPGPEDQIPTWSGSPLDKQNLGAYLQEGTQLCQIGDPRKMEAVLVVEQDDIEFIQIDQEVAIKLDALPGATFETRITDISLKPLEFTPKQLSNKSGGEVVTKTDPSGAERPQNTSYSVLAPLPDNDLLTIGMRGRCKIHARWQTIGERTWRMITRTFNFKL